MTQDLDTVLAITAALLPGEFAALGPRADDAVAMALASELLEPPPHSDGRQNISWPLVEHVFAVANFVKLVVDLKFAYDKRQEELTAKAVADVARASRIHIPSDADIAKIFPETIQRVASR